MAQIDIEQRPLWKSPSEALTSGNITSIIDCYIDEEGNIVSRPGYSEFSSVGSSFAVQGLYWHRYTSKLIAVVNSEIYSIDSSGVATKCPGAFLNGPYRVHFVEVGNKVYAANGKKLTVIDPVIFSSSHPTDPDIPTTISGLTIVGQYMVLSVEGGEKFYYSTPGNYLSYNPLDFISAETKPDKLVTVRSAWNELYLFSKDTIEVYFNDPNTVFARYEGGYANVGVLSRDTLVEINNNFYFLDSTGRVSVFNGRKREMISQQINNELDNYSNLAASYAFSLYIGGRYFYCISFVNDDVTWAYDTLLSRWVRFSFYNSTTGTYERFVANCSTLTQDNVNYIGDRNSTGKVYIVSENTYLDNGNEIRCEVKTGHVDHGSLNYKKSLRLKLNLLRGKKNVSNAKVMLRFNDDKVLGNEITVDVGSASYKNTVVFNRLGIYRKRQYIFSFSGDSPFILAPPEEDVILLGR